MGITGPVFAIVKMARPAAVYVATSIRPRANVVTDGVGHQVHDEALDQLRVAGCSGGVERRGAPEFALCIGSQDFGGSGGEVDGLPSQMSVLASGEGEQRLE